MKLSEMKKSEVKEDQHDDIDELFSAQMQMLGSTPEQLEMYRTQTLVSIQKYLKNEARTLVVMKRLLWAFLFLLICIALLS